MTYPDPSRPPTGYFRSQASPQPPTFGPPPRRAGLSTGVIVAIVLGSVFAVCVLGCVVLLATSDPKPAATEAAEGKPAAAGTATTAAGSKAGTTAAKTSDVAPVGSAVRDGKFEFKVTKGPECGKKQIGNEKAQDQFCTITLNVKNVGNDARTFDDSNVYAFNAAGAKFESDGVAGMYANPDGESFLENINPGSQVNVVVVFDVAASVKLTALELHDSMFSRGAKVALP